MWPSTFGWSSIIKKSDYFDFKFLIIILIFTFIFYKKSKNVKENMEDELVIKQEYVNNINNLSNFIDSLSRPNAVINKKLKINSLNNKALYNYGLIIYYKKIYI